MRSLVIVVPGTRWNKVPAWAETYRPESKPMREIGKIFACEPELFQWSGANSARERHAAAHELARAIAREERIIHLVGFSHGGNVAIEAAARMPDKVDVLVTIATPVTGNYRTGGARRHINLYSPTDRMQILGGEGPLGLPRRAGREFPEAANEAIYGIESADMTGAHGNILWSDETWSVLGRMLGGG